MILLPWPKKRTILEIRGEKNAVPRVISCSIRRDQRRAKVADSRGSDVALRWSRLIEHDITRGTAFFSPRISMMVLFFGQGSTCHCIVCVTDADTEVSEASPFSSLCHCSHDGIPSPTLCNASVSVHSRVFLLYLECFSDLSLPCVLGMVQG